MLAYFDTLIGFAVVMLGISLLITILTQMISAALSLRGVNLRWGIKILLAQIDSENLKSLTAKAEDIAQAVLTHPLISDSMFSGQTKANRFVTRFRLASAIRPDEFVAILSRVAPSFGADVEKDIETLLGADQPVSIHQVTPQSEAAPVLDDMSSKDAVPVIQRPVGRTRRDLEGWFNTMTGRIGQRFAMHTRLWTILFACTFAGVTGLDSIRLLNDLYSHGDFREKLAGQAPALLGAAAKVKPPDVPTAQEAAQKALSSVYGEALKKAISGTNVLQKVPSSIATEDEGRRWIDLNVSNDQRKGAADAYDGALAEGTRTFIEQRARDGAAVTNILDNAGFETRKIYWPIPWSELPSTLPGILTTAALLSLGAPFWFNLLKSLSNLKPILALKDNADELGEGNHLK